MERRQLAAGLEQEGERVVVRLGARPPHSPENGDGVAVPGDAAGVVAEEGVPEEDAGGAVALEGEEGVECGVGGEVGGDERGWEGGGVEEEAGGEELLVESAGGGEGAALVEEGGGSGGGGEEAAAALVVVVGSEVAEHGRGVPLGQIIEWVVGGSVVGSGSPCHVYDSFGSFLGLLIIRKHLVSTPLDLTRNSIFKRSSSNLNITLVELVEFEQDRV